MKLTIGISACLVGQEVRYDKSHKTSNFCTKELGRHVEFRPVCPEVAIGLPIPRPTIRQTQRGEEIIVSRPDFTGDVTKELTEFGQKVAAKSTDLSGFIFTAKSPSCGMERVKVYQLDENEKVKGTESYGVGQFAKQIMESNPALPCEENGRLNDPIIRENFVLRIYAYNTWLTMAETGLTKHKLIQFHTQYKYLLLSHSQKAYRELGNLLGTSDLDVESLGKTYINQFMQALKTKASRRSHFNTLQHLQGYFSKHLSAEQKRELTQHIIDYKDGLVPLIAPLTLIKHYLTMYPNMHLSQQKYLDPYPADLRLRYGY